MFMHFKNLKLRLSIFLLFFFNCENKIIERSIGDYFPIKEGNWWLYSNEDLYNPKMVDVKIESLDTILQTECYPFNFSGDFHYFAKDTRGIKEYIRITQYYEGMEWTILEGFIRRLELPMVKGNQYIDSLTDSLDFFGEWIKGRYYIKGLVSDYEVDELYGTVYRVIITTIRTIESADSTITKEESFEEYYAPDIGMIRFKNQEGDFKLTDFHIE